MEVEVRADPSAYRRHRRRMILGFLTFGLGVPTTILLAALMSKVLGREAAGPYVVAVFGASLVGWIAVMMRVGLDSFFYRCPQCGRALSKVEPGGKAEPDLHYHCPDCRTIWDLGWGWARGGGVGG